MMEMEHLSQPTREALFAIGSLCGLNMSSTAFTVLLVVNVFIAFLFKRIRAPALRAGISLSLGLLWCYLLYGISNTLVLLAISGGVYVVVVRELLSPNMVAVGAIAVLSAFHIHRMVVDYMGWNIGITGSLMLFTAKFTNFAYEIQDGKRLKEGNALSSEQHVADARSRTCLTARPSLFEFYLFIFDFLGVLAGPIFHCREYLDFIHLRNEFCELNRVHFAGVALRKFGAAIACGAVYSLAGRIPQLSFDYIRTKEYQSQAILVKLLFIHIITVASRMKYYFAWYMADTACLIAGIGYNPSNRDKFSRAQNASITKVDWANCQSEAASQWNISISKWLRNCIYLRALESPMPKVIQGSIGHRPYATLLTRFTSAFWHGFYPGYYFCFVSTVLQFEADSVARKFIRPIFTKEGATHPHWIYTLGGKIHCALCLNYYGSAFQVLSAAAALEVWSSVYYCVHVFNLATILLVPRVFKRFRIPQPSVHVDSSKSKKTE